jgi:hypothetical protein
MIFLSSLSKLGVKNKWVEKEGLRMGNGDAQKKLRMWVERVIECEINMEDLIGDRITIQKTE